MASIYNSRKFNLVPPRSKEEEGAIQERDSSFFYSFILIFCAIIVFTFLTLAQSLIVDPKVAQNKQNISDIEAQISSYDALKKTHGELYIKSQALDSILVQDIKLTQLLDISDQLKINIPNSQVIAYTRETSGQFVIDLRLDNITDINQIFDNSEKIDVLEGLNLRSVNIQDINGTNYVVARVGFYITNIINAQ